MFALLFVLLCCNVVAINAVVVCIVVVLLFPLTLLLFCYCLVEISVFAVSAFVVGGIVSAVVGGDTHVSSTADPTKSIVINDKFEERI